MKLRDHAARRSIGAMVERDARTSPDRCNGQASGDLISSTKNPSIVIWNVPTQPVARRRASDVVCTKRKEDAGPNNNWMEPQEANTKIDALFKGAMKGRTL